MARDSTRSSLCPRKGCKCDERQTSEQTIPTQKISPVRTGKYWEREGNTEKLQNTTV